jgi:hypothetical protein
MKIVFPCVKICNQNLRRIHFTCLYCRIRRAYYKKIPKKIGVWMYIIRLRGYYGFLLIDRHRKFATPRGELVLKYLGLIEKIKFHVPDKILQKLLTIAEALSCSWF